MTEETNQNEQETLSAIEKEEVKQKNDLLSRKFMAFMITLIIGIAGFCLLVFKFNDAKFFDKFLDFILFCLVTYIGGNNLEKISDKIGAKWEK